MKKHYFYIIGLMIALIIGLLTQICVGYEKEDIWKGILIEANGIVLEFLMIVILYEAYNKQKERQIKNPLLDISNTRIHQKSTMLVESLLDINKSKADRIYIKFGREDGYYSCSLNYYKDILENYDFKTTSQEYKKALEDKVREYIKDIENVISYNIYDLEFCIELRKMLEECNNFIKNQDNPRSKRPAIKLLLELLSKLSGRASIEHIEEVW